MEDVVVEHEHNKVTLPVGMVSSQLRHDVQVQKHTDDEDLWLTKRGHIESYRQDQKSDAKYGLKS